VLGRWRVIEFNDIGELVSPVAIAGFEGWNDAGEAASGVVNHLGIAWQATPIGAIDPEDLSTTWGSPGRRPPSAPLIPRTSTTSRSTGR